MKKDQHLPNKIVIVVQENHFQITLNILDNNLPIIRIIEDDQHTKGIHKISHKTDIVEIVNTEITIQDQIQPNLIFRLMPHPIQILEKEIIQIFDLETFHTIDIEITPTIDRKRDYSNNRNPTYQHNRSRDYSKNRSKYNNYQNRSGDNSQNINSIFNNRQRNYSQSPYRNNTRYQNS